MNNIRIIVPTRIKLLHTGKNRAIEGLELAAKPSWFGLQNYQCDLVTTIKPRFNLAV